MRATAAESSLIGKRLSADNIAEAGRLAASACEPSSDLRGSEAYKRDVTRVVLKRAVELAYSRAKGARS